MAIIAPPPAGGGRQLLQEITLSSSVPGEFDFNDISQAYNRLSIEGELRATPSAQQINAHIYFNSDLTNSNYRWYRNLVFTNAHYVTSDVSPRFAHIPAALATADHYGYVRIAIENYTGGNAKGAATASRARWNATTGGEVGDFFISNSSMTAAITRLRVRAQNHDTDLLFGTLRLYGEM